MTQNILDTPIEYLKGIGSVRAEALKKDINIHNFYDLINYFPLRYVDRSKIININEVISDAVYVQIKGKIKEINLIGNGRKTRLSIVVSDKTGSIEIVFFKAVKWVKSKLKVNSEYIIFGKPNIFNNKLNFTHPEIEDVNDDFVVKNDFLQPYYSTTERLKSLGFTARSFAKIIQRLLMQLQDNIPEQLSEYILSTNKLISRHDAYQNIHFPNSIEDLEKAKRRIKFDEFFFIQMELLELKFNRYDKRNGFVFSKVGDNFNIFFKKYLPFVLTDAQKRVIKEIRNDLRSGNQMNRLLQGDVGSGKTLVALMTMLLASDNGFQSCIMAPTEILANQHYNSIKKMLGDMNVVISLLTGATKAKERKKLHEDLQNGKIDILIGTHALIEDEVKFMRLGLAIIDEQHRFGVEQRSRLWEKSKITPHVLVMTATPIPRTLAMTLYGDLEISIIDQLPSGRKPIKTFHFFEKERLKVLQFMKKQIAEGRQIYIVYPLIKESEKLDLQYLIDGFDTISRYFPLPEYQISVVHGQLKSAEKEIEMQRFINKTTQIMMATTVIEVGVDVPNATVMVIENAERFGLSQLHQLRGRVGRGSEQSFCILMSNYKLSADANKRLATMVRTNDGFEIAEVDMKLRGPGDLQGTKQSGLVGLKLANIITDESILKLARQSATNLLSDDPKLMKQSNCLIKLALQKRNSGWAEIS